MDRRSLLRFAGLAALGSALPLSAKEPNTASRPLGALRRTTRSARSGVGSVVTPNGSTLPLRRSGRVLVGHLVAQVVDHEFAPGLKALVWGYNGGTPARRGRHRRPGVRGGGRVPRRPRGEAEARDRTDPC